MRRISRIRPRHPANDNRALTRVTPASKITNPTNGIRFRLATNPTVSSYESWGMTKEPDTSGWDFPSYSATDSRVSNGNAVGLLKLSGDPNGGAAFPNWSHDGTTILYASTHAALSGRLAINDGSGSGAAHGTPGSTDLYTVPFNEGQGGAVKPVNGAATKEFEEYLGVYTPDDQLIAYTRVPAGETMYANPHAEIAVISAEGGKAVTSGINKPPACTGKTSPGVNNVWPRFAPGWASTGGLSYYFLIFSSSRAGKTANSQFQSGAIPIVQLPENKCRDAHADIGFKHKSSTQFHAD